MDFFGVTELVLKSQEDLQATLLEDQEIKRREEIDKCYTNHLNGIAKLKAVVLKMQEHASLFSSHLQEKDKEIALLKRAYGNLMNSVSVDGSVCVVCYGFVSTTISSVKDFICSGNVCSEGQQTVICSECVSGNRHLIKEYVRYVTDGKISHNECMTRNTCMICYDAMIKLGEGRYRYQKEVHRDATIDACFGEN